MFQVTPFVATVQVALSKLLDKGGLGTGAWQGDLDHRECEPRLYAVICLKLVKWRAYDQATVSQVQRNREINLPHSQGLKCGSFKLQHPTS